MKNRLCEIIIALIEEGESNAFITRALNINMNSVEGLQGLLDHQLQVQTW